MLGAFVTFKFSRLLDTGSKNNIEQMPSGAKLESKARLLWVDAVKATSKSI